MEIRADWAVVEQIEFQQLQKLSAAPPEPEELYVIILHLIKIIYSYANTRIGTLRVQ